MRPLLSETKVTAQALKSIESFHPEIIAEIQKAISEHEWVVVGMNMNPVVKQGRKHLAQKNIAYHYIGRGSYFSAWKVRLAVKLWSGWPTFPQIFHKGILIGGASDLKKYLP